MNKLSFTALLLCLLSSSLFAESAKTWTPDQIGLGEFSLKPDKSFSYKLVDLLGQPYELKIHAFFPKDHKFTNNTPAALFFHGVAMPFGDFTWE
ncbi:hypothetical protein LNTAR_22849 [Lentisphaera araneosa HTCC2155]|jgi:hypothetical protein|uniref:Uncharacterized protein n=1 Tax=Lentisphaera araneosa HTCC2155 TaxID=313628 RepID=A6DGG1_9BACT|nr:hypothetical protein [Lentisphaera araneosa]EDM29278.1 hypothetical protein LNTAR_22849 [Lentisphaera araneosa HTCC2155]